MNGPPKRHIRINPIAATIGAAAIVVAAALGVSTQTVDTPTLATAVGPGLDVNIVRWSDEKVAVQPVTFDDAGHAAKPSWRPGGLPGRVPLSPVMNWNFTGARQVAGRELPLRYCLAELAASGQPYEVPFAVRGVLDEFQAVFDLLPFEESCDAPAMVLGPTAGQDCVIGDGAWGCAWLLGPHMRITHNGNVYATGQMTLDALRETYRHEIGHFFDRDHTRCDHGHPTNMTPVGCGTPRIAVEDYADAHLGIRLRQHPPPSFPPKATPPPPTPSPTPPPPVVKVRLQRWIEASREPCAQPSGEFCIQTGSEVEEPTDQRPWYTLVIDRDGQYEYPLPFIEVGPTP